MNRIVTVFVLLLSLAVCALALDKSKWNVGVTAGLNIANVKASGTPGVSYSSVTKFAFGGALNYKIDDDMSVRTDLIYIGKGAKLSAQGSTGDEAKIANLAIAPFLVYNLAGDPKDIQWFAQGGLEMDLNMSSDWKSGGTIANYNSTEFDLNIGFGARIAAAKGYWVPNLRYSLGLTNTTSTSGVTSKNNGVQLMVAYLFNRK